MQGQSEALFGAIEAGGTKFVCAIADAQGTLLDETRFPTTTPEATLKEASDFLRSAGGASRTLSGIGIASFGPVHLRRESHRYGCIGKTPKAGWSGADVVGTLSSQFSCPIGFDTDVNAAALAEHRWGAAQGLDSMAYVTIGTGIGGGVIQRGGPIHGLMHPEIGHIHPRRHPKDTSFAGVCPFHGDCLEGLASGPAILARSGREFKDIDAANPQWEIEADYLGQLCAQLVVMVSPQRIVLGGGVMGQLALLPPIRQRMLHWLGGYVDRAEILDGVDTYIVAPALSTQSGVLGAVLLAIEASIRFNAK